MRDYYQNNKKVTKAEWQELYKQNLTATVIIRTEKLLEPYKFESDSSVISPEQARQIRNQRTL